MKKILIVVDMQNDFIDGSLGTDEAAAVVGAAAEKIKSFDGDIFVTLDTHFENYLKTSEGRMLPVRHCIKNSEGWKLNGEIKSALEGKNYETVEKNTFGSVRLPEIIKERYDAGEIGIELIGLCTDICVVSNALILKANFPETPISVDLSCCAGVTRDLHSAAAATMRSCQININGGNQND